MRVYNNTNQISVQLFNCVMKNKFSASVFNCNSIKVQNSRIYKKLFCRDVWPENDSFGKPNITSEEEFLALREVFFADLGGEYFFTIN